MSRKKTSREKIPTRDDNENIKITKEDATCPICQEIFDIPVLLPCKHRICEDCFMGIIDHANIECPFCRRRLNTWVRTNKIGKLGCKKFIDTKFIKSIGNLREELGDDLLTLSEHTIRFGAKVVI